MRNLFLIETEPMPKANPSENIFLGGDRGWRNWKITGYVTFDHPLVKTYFGGGQG